MEKSPGGYEKEMQMTEDKEKVVGVDCSFRP